MKSLVFRSAGVLRTWGAALAVSGSLLASPAAWADGVQALEQFVQHARAGQARFTQVVTTPGAQGQAGRSKTSSGQFAFQRPGQFRFDYTKPFEQTIVADGQTLWLHDVDLNQVTARPQQQALDASPAAILAAATSLQALEKDFEISAEPDQDGQQWIRAVPRTPQGQIQSVRMGFAPAAQAGQAPLLRTLEMNDSFGQHSLIRFEQFTLSPSLPASRFEFRPPEGAEVLRP